MTEKSDDDQQKAGIVDLQAFRERKGAESRFIETVKRVRGPKVLVLEDEYTDANGNLLDCFPAGHPNNGVDPMDIHIVTGKVDPGWQLKESLRKATRALAEDHVRGRSMSAENTKVLLSELDLIWTEFRHIVAEMSARDPDGKA